ncbi:hypothetical protein CFII64_14305 [Pseudomonas sp. CFII64]|nr:hypothetical protein [Pseudomonas sp. CFII64]EPJ84423.1 hypothetical protein CFII64_14305 [Pseudomonas sp. CFII64]
MAIRYGAEFKDWAVQKMMQPLKDLWQSSPLPPVVPRKRFATGEKWL